MEERALIDERMREIRAARVRGDRLTPRLVSTATLLELAKDAADARRPRLLTLAFIRSLDAYEGHVLQPIETDESWVICACVCWQRGEPRQAEALLDVRAETLVSLPVGVMARPSAG
jgi:hypothetical protein